MTGGRVRRPARRTIITATVTVVAVCFALTVSALALRHRRALELEDALVEQAATTPRMVRLPPVIGANTWDAAVVMCPYASESQVPERLAATAAGVDTNDDSRQWVLLAKGPTVSAQPVSRSRIDFCTTSTPSLEIAPTDTFRARRVGDGYLLRPRS